MDTTNLHIAILSCTAEANHVCFWESESVGTKAAGQAPDNAFLGQYMRTHITTQPDGIYSLWFPWKDGHPTLPSNYTACSRRTRSLALRLAINNLTSTSFQPPYGTGMGLPACHPTAPGNATQPPPSNYTLSASPTPTLRQLY